jgi:hypothetical protein
VEVTQAGQGLLAALAVADTVSQILQTLRGLELLDKAITVVKVILIIQLLLILAVVEALAVLEVMLLHHKAVTVALDFLPLLLGNL